MSWSIRNYLHVPFPDFRKRHERAEKEFVEAKLQLHTTSERKEQLTEHLCTIIEQTEQRKAEKLKEIMKELDITADQWINGLSVDLLPINLSHVSNGVP